MPIPTPLNVMEIWKRKRQLCMRREVEEIAVIQSTKFRRLEHMLNHLNE